MSENNQGGSVSTKTVKRNQDRILISIKPELRARLDEYVSGCNIPTDRSKIISAAVEAWLKTNQ